MGVMGIPVFFEENVLELPQKRVFDVIFLIFLQEKGFFYEKGYHKTYF